MRDRLGELQPVFTEHGTSAAAQRAILKAMEAGALPAQWSAELLGAKLARAKLLEGVLGAEGWQVGG